jgi:hypothetical protein
MYDKTNEVVGVILDLNFRITDLIDQLEETTEMTVSQCDLILLYQLMTSRRIMFMTLEGVSAEEASFPPWPDLGLQA